MAAGELSFKEFTKVLLVTALSAIQNELLLLQTKILAREISNKSFAGIATSAVLIALITASFSAAKAKIQGFAKGIDYVNGPGNGTSDSINVNVSKGEGIIPAHINKKMLGLGVGATDPNLPSYIQAGLNTLKMESILENVNKNTSLTASYLSHGRNNWTENINGKEWTVTQDWQSGTIRMKPKK